MNFQKIILQEKIRLQQKKTDTNKDNESAQGENSIAKEKVFLPMREMKEKYPILDKMPFLLPIYWLIRIVSVVILKNTAN